MRRVLATVLALAAAPAIAQHAMHDHMDDDPIVATLQADELEWRDDDALAWDVHAWIGGAQNRLLVRTEGERADGTTQHGDAEVLWSHATGPWWNRVVGVRTAFGPGPSRTALAIGVEGLAPYKIDIGATAYIGTSGRVGARVEAEYEAWLTRRWRLQPKFEANLASRDDPARHLGSGVTDASFGVRLHYVVGPQFAPYFGYAWTRNFGGTADAVRAEGGDPSVGRWVAGVQFWF